MFLRDTLIKLCITLLLLAPFVFLYKHFSANTAPTPPQALSAITLPQTLGSTTANGGADQPDQFALFIVESYDKVMQIHYIARSEAEMNALFLPTYLIVSSSTKKLSDIAPTRNAFVQFLIDDFIPRPEADKRRIAIAVVGTVVGNLPPLGHNSLMSDHQETALRNLVSNIDTSKNLYNDIGVASSAPKEEITKKFEEQKVVLEASSAPAAKVELAKITYAKNVLTNTETKARYDTKLIEPTVFSHEVSDTMLYIYVSKIAPTTMDEFTEALARASTSPSLSRLVIDLRGNIGGALDFPLSFFGAYEGKGVPVLELSHQNATRTEETITDKLPALARFTKQVVITDRGTQSTAEVVSAFFKKKKLALLIGDRTAGWGTVENTFPLTATIDQSTKYALFLVHSLTIADDGKPIQGRGVQPNVNVTEKGWDEKLLASVKDKDFAKTLWQIMSVPPER